MEGSSFSSLSDDNLDQAIKLFIDGKYKILKKETSNNNQKAKDGSKVEETLDRIVELFDGEILN